GKRTELSTLRQQYSTSLQGTSLTRLLQLAETLSLASRPVRADLGELDRLQLPCLLHWNLDHFVVLEKLDRRGAAIADPALGRRRVNPRELSRAFSGVAVELVPAPAFEACDGSNRLRFRQLVTDARSLLAGLTMVFVLSLALQFLALLMPFYSQLVIDDVVLSGDRDLLALLAISCALLILMQTAISMLRSWVVVTLSTRFNLQLVSRVFSHLLRLPLSYFEKRHLGDVQSRFAAAGALQQLITRQFVEAAIDGLMAVTTLWVMFAYDYRLASVVLGSVVIYFVARAVMVPSLHSASQEAQVMAASRDSHFLESVRGLLAIKSSCQEWQRDLGFQNCLAEAWNPAIRGSRLQIWQLGINQLLFGLQFVVVVWLAALAILDSRFTTGMLVAFLAYRALFTERAAALIDRLLEFRLARVLLDRLADIVQTDRELAYSSSAVNFRRTDSRLTIRASNLSFRYGECDADVLKQVSFGIHAGEHVVLTGPSGCGKTTLIKVLMGLLEPTRGEL
ncbi:MAG: ABC transporter transmembrane domain-containing protein, partial [Woeseia sp.]